MHDQSFIDACVMLGVESKIPLFHRYLESILVYNEKVNLIGRQQSIDRLFHHHLLDCLLVLPYINPLHTLCDVGSGAGFPGLCWALACDDLHITLIEKVQKKALFLTDVVQELKLSNRVTVFNRRVELVKLKADTISCRALTQIAEFMKLTEHLGHQQTQWLLLKAKKETIDLELEDLDTKRWSADITPLIHPTQEVTRHLIEITRKK